jgi:subtilisin family serine protease
MKPVKIAVLDTGINMNSPFLRMNQNRIEAETFLSEGDASDTDSHGTFVVGLLLRVARNATIYVAKVSESLKDPDVQAITNVC